MNASESSNYDLLHVRNLQRLNPELLKCHNDIGCLWREQFTPLLEAMHWKGTQREFEEALPRHDGYLDIQDFRGAMANLGFTSYVRVGYVNNISPRWLPLIAVDESGTPRVITSMTPEPGKRVQLLLFEPAKAPVMIDEAGSFMVALRRFAPVLLQAVLISLLIGALGLAPTFFNMAIYDHIIASGSTDGLFMLVAGALIALGAESSFRQLRVRSLGFFGARLDHFVSCSVFERLLSLSPSYTERVSVSAQLARLRDFESVREFFTGPLATLFFELPIVMVYLIAMAVMGHWLVMVPLALMLAYAILLFIMLPRLKENSRFAARCSTRRQEFLLETVSKLPNIRLAGLEKKWQERYRKISGQASLASFHAAFSAQGLETASYVLMTLGGIATLSFGVLALINQSLTTGALVASMMIVWRIITPMQIACSSITRLQQLSSSTKQVQRLLAVGPEFDIYKHKLPLAMDAKRVTFHRVSLRYSPEAEPALLGVSFEARPGQIIAICGGNGSGKSTIIKMLLALYQPQSGSVRLDGIDIRQIDPLVLRQAVGYAPQNADFFPGTIRDNLLYADPAADERVIMQALKISCAFEEVMSLPDRLDTIIEGEGADSISFMLGQRLNLARAYMRPSPLMLFDEASHSLGKQNDIAFMQVLQALRGHSTVLMVTHREDHMLLADQLLVLSHGELTHAGPPGQILTLLKGKH